MNWKSHSDQRTSRDLAAIHSTVRTFCQGISLKSGLARRPGSVQDLFMPVLPEDLSRPTPVWLEPWLRPLIVISAIGLFVSFWVHVGAVTGKFVAPSALFLTLHVGVFIVFFPAVIIANRKAGYRRRKYYWDYVLQGSFTWMRYMLYMFSGYAVLNFVIFTLQRLQTVPHSSSGGPTFAEWRGFSGHWMAFYSCAFVILFSAAKRKAAPHVSG